VAETITRGCYEVLRNIRMGTWTALAYSVTELNGQGNRRFRYRKITSSTTVSSSCRILLRGVESNVEMNGI
jgi:hypothetical protein